MPWPNAQAAWRSTYRATSRCSRKARSEGLPLTFRVGGPGEPQKHTSRTIDYPKPSILQVLNIKPHMEAMVLAVEGRREANLGILPFFLNGQCPAFRQQLGQRKPSCHQQQYSNSLERSCTTLLQVSHGSSL